MIRALRVLARSFRDFYLDAGVAQAAALAYFVMMTMVPFLLFLISLAGHFMGGARFYRFFFSRIINYFPQGTERVALIVDHLGRYRGTGVSSLALYGLLSYGLFLNVEKAMNIIFKVKKGRHVLHSAILAVFVILLIGVLILFSLVFNGFEPVLMFLGRTLKLREIHLIIIKYILPGILLFAVSSAVYFFMPARKIRPSEAMWGALFTSSAIEAAKRFFALYIRHVWIGRFYGPLSAFMVFLLWIFYCSCIFIVGGEIAHNAGAAGKGVKR